MKLFYSHNGVKLIKRAKIIAYYFLFILGIFSGLFLNRLGFFLKVFDSKQLNQK
jgi:hypothetical protein